MAAVRPPLAPRATVALTVAGTTEPLVGSEALFQRSLFEQCRAALERHGYAVSDSGASYHATLQYRTTRYEAMELESSVSSSAFGGTSQGARAGAGAGSGAHGSVGAGIAAVVQSAFTASTTTATTSVKSRPSYAQTVAVEIKEAGGKVVWKGDASWDSRDVDLTLGGTTAIKLLVSDLPGDTQLATSVDEIKTSHVRNYYRLYCNDPKFACPGLPHLIRFPKSLNLSSDVDGRRKQTKEGRELSLPSGVRDGYALAAYRDLVESAEIALPLGGSLRGGKSAWKDPLATMLWSRVQLGGRYELGPTHKPVSVLVTLATGAMEPGAGRAAGTCYIVKDAHVATPEEYAVFERDLGEWRSTLERYFNVSVR